MTAGRHRGNHDQGFRSRVSDVVVSTKIEPCKDGIHDEGGGIRRNHLDSRDRIRFRNMDLNEGETINGLHHTSSSTSNSSGCSGSDLVQKKRHNVLGDLVDREPGELLSGSSDSEDQDAPQSEMVKSRKRKFSPVVWDKNGSKNATVVTTSEAVNYTGTLPPPPPLPKGFMPSNSTDAVVISKNCSPLDTKSLTAVGHEDDSLGSTEHRKMELEEEYVPTRNISASRWADGDASEDDETRPTKRNKKTPMTLRKMASTSDLGEAVLKECAASEAKGQYDDNEDGKDYIDEKGSEKTPAYLSDSDNEERSVVNKTPERVQPPHRCINMLLGCRSVDEFERLNKIDEGTYGVVYRAKDKKTGEVVALKKVKMEKEREGFPLTSLREINILLSFHHPSIVDVKEVVVGRSLDSIFMVMEYMDHDLKGLIESLKHPFSQSEVKCLMLQLLDGVKYLHDNWVLHRDLKTSNLLFNNCGELKICDLGLSRQYGSPMKPYTRLVVTLWYRSPELLLGTREYSTAIDMWSLGCIMAELLAKEPLFNGKTEFDQLNKIFKILGTPNEKIWPGFSKLPGVKVNLAKHPYNRLREKFPPTSFSGRPTLSEKGFDLLNKLLTYDPEMRITADEALNHEWFKEVPLPKSKDFMPTFPAQHSQDRRLRRIFKSPDPLEEQRQRELQHGGIAMGSLFN